MDYRLGLDLGTNSIGWSVYSLNKDTEPENLVDLGVRIFSDGRNPKTKEPLAVERRTARGQRKNIYRRKLRRRATFRLLQKEDLLPKTKEESQSLKLLNPYELRIKALDEKLEPYELGRVLFNLSVRRGFKSNRKDGSQEEEKENSKSEKLTQSDKCNNLLKTIKESGCRTIGEYLWKNQDKNNGIRFVPGRMDYYPVRQLYIDEFNFIKEKQEQFYKNVDWEAIYHQLFDQRPLKVQERGKCQYMPNEERTFKAMPCAQKIRILQDIYNLTFIEKGKSHNLIQEWREELIKLFDFKEKVTFNEIRKVLELNEDITFNLESESREFLQGNSTAVKLRKDKCFGSIWDTLQLPEQDQIVELLITAQEDSEVQKMLSKYDLTEEQKSAIIKITLPSGTTSFCKEFSEQVVSKIEEEKCHIHNAIEKLGFTYAEQKVEKSDTLPYYGKVLVGSTMGIKANPKNEEEQYGKISNPTVHIALNQTRTVVNALIKQYGKPKQIVIELSRDLKASREAKAAILKRQTENQKRNAILNETIASAYKDIPYPNRNDRLKYRLWEELSPKDSLVRRCIYCGKQISGAELFTKNIEIEHILPYSRTLSDSENNLTVAHASCNAFKKEHSPFEAFGSNPTGYNWDSILARANLLKNPAKKACFTENAMEKFEKDSSFIKRQLTDNAYLSKSALRYLKAVCDDVWSVNGGMTKLLRDKWEIDSILKRKIDKEEIAYFDIKDEQIGLYKKNRYDHRHHALDASIIALIDRSMVKQISDLNKQHRKNRIEVPQMPVLRSELIEKTRNIVVSFKPDHGAQGKLSKETLLGKIKRPVAVNISEIKTEKDISTIRNDKVRGDFDSKLKELKDMKLVQKELREIYPTVWVYKEYFVTRTSIVSLKEKDIEDIIDDKIRDKLKTFIEKHKGEKIEDVMTKFSETSGIKKVRCLNNVQTPIEITSDIAPRYLAPEDYFVAIIWQIPPKKEGLKPTYQGTFIRRDEVDAKGNPKNLKQPHPAAKNLGIIHKNDYLEFSDNGKWYKCRVAGFSACDGRIDYRPIFSVTNCKDWLISTNESVTETCWKRTKGQNYISINVLFGEKQARYITVNPIGKVFRKK